MNKSVRTAVPATAKDYLGRPYTRALIPQDDGTFLAEIPAFPGCIATGRTPEEAYKELEETALSWLEAVIQTGQAIPEALDDNSYSGKFALRMSKGLHRRAAQLAEREGCSLNQFIVSCVAEGVGLRSTHGAPKVNFVSGWFGGPMTSNLSAHQVHPIPIGSVTKISKATING